MRALVGDRTIPALCVVAPSGFLGSSRRSSTTPGPSCFEGLATTPDEESARPVRPANWGQGRTGESGKELGTGYLCGIGEESGENPGTGEEAAPPASDSDGRCEPSKANRGPNRAMRTGDRAEENRGQGRPVRPRPGWGQGTCVESGDRRARAPSAAGPSTRADVDPCYIPIHALLSRASRNACQNGEAVRCPDAFRPFANRAVGRRRLQGERPGGQDSLSPEARTCNEMALLIALAVPISGVMCTLTP